MMKNNIRGERITTLFRWAVFLIFLGRAWQHLVWDAPFREIFRDQHLMESLIIALRGGTWQEYVQDPSLDLGINVLTRIFGIFYLFLAGVTLWLDKSRCSRRIEILYIASTISLSLLAFLYCKERNYQVGQFSEYSIQMFSPILFYLFISEKIKVSPLILAFKIIIGFTFVSHGLYAVGYYPRPAIFIEMCVQILGISPNVALQFLNLAGTLDFLLVLFLFLPFRRLTLYALLYASFWGLLTALARVWSPLKSSPETLAIINEYLPQTIYRLAHGLIPLTAWLTMGIKEKSPSERGAPTQGLGGLHSRMSNGDSQFKN